MIISEWVRNLRVALTPASREDASYEARTIACTLLHRPYADLLASREEIPAEVCAEAERILAGRAEHVPLGYLLGRVDFAGLPFFVTPDTLIPRADTEMLVSRAVAKLPQGGALLDLCTGSGCVLLATLSQVSEAMGHGVDISGAALDVAKKNTEALKLSARVTLAQADVFDDAFLAGCGDYDVITANPPYIASGVIPSLSQEVRHEPTLALDGGEDGLRFYKRLLAVCPAHLQHGGTLLFEIGYDQRAALTSLCQENGFAATFTRDFGGQDRVCEISV